MKFQNDREDKKIYGASWADEKQLKRNLVSEPINGKTYKQGGIPVITEGSMQYMDCSDSHNMIFGTTGSKKTRLFAMPLLMNLIKGGESFMVTDPKNELYDRTSGYLEEYGYKTVVLNFRDFDKGQGWNPLLWPYTIFEEGKQGKAEELLEDLCNGIRATVHQEKDSFWENTATSLVHGLMQVLLELGTKEEQSFDSLLKLHRTFMESKEVADCILKQLAEYGLDSMVLSKLSPYSNVAQNTRAGVMIVVETMLNTIVKQRDMTAKMCTSVDCLQGVADQKTAIYLILPDEKETYHFIASIFVKQLYEYLIYHAQKQEGNRMKIRMNFVLDEFANMPTIDGMNSMISAGRSRNIRFHLFVQSMNQLESKYDKYAQTIMGNCNNLFFLASREKSILDHMEYLCGTVKYEEEAEHPLISSFELQHLEKERGEALALIGRNNPYITHLYDIDEYHYEKRLPLEVNAPVEEHHEIFEIREWTEKKKKIINTGRKRLFPDV